MTKFHAFKFGRSLFSEIDQPFISLLWYLWSILFVASADTYVECGPRAPNDFNPCDGVTTSDCGNTGICYVRCIDKDSCIDDTIICPRDYDCFIECGHSTVYDGCLRSTFICPINGQCNFIQETTFISSNYINDPLDGTIICAEPLTNGTCLITTGGARNTQIYCSDHADCSVNITAIYPWNSFYDTTIICPFNDYLCSVTIQNAYTFGNTIIGGGGVLTVTALEKYSLTDTTIHCPVAKECNITIDSAAAEAGKGLNIFAQHANTLNIISKTSKALIESIIYCPSDTVRGNTNNCNIEVDANDTFQNTFIQAVEAVNDVNIVCNQPYNTSCGTVFIGCESDSSQFCEIHRTGPSDYDCIDITNGCYNYLLPTPLPTSEPSTFPTEQPSTKYPSISPTLPAFSSSNVLYVRSINSCDTAFCSNPIGDCNDTSYDPPCQSIEYGLNCLFGVNSTDCVDIYDGQGTINVGSGQFGILNDIKMEKNQVIIEGVDAIETIITNAADIDIERMAHFKIKDVRYASSSSYHQIKVHNKGHTVFEQVVFNQSESIEFYFSDGATEFVECSFDNTQHLVFNISNEAAVVFKGCMFEGTDVIFDITSSSTVHFESDTRFINNIGATNQAMINIKASTVYITDTIFERNNGYSSLIETTNTENANMYITYCLFRLNTNITQILYTLNSFKGTSSIFNTVFDDNYCDNDKCLVFVNSKLKIDETSLTEYASTPTPSPTFYPTTQPTQSPIPPLEAKTFIGPYTSIKPTVLGMLSIHGQTLNISLDVVFYSLPSVWTEVFSIVDHGNGDDARWAKLYTRSDVGFLFEYRAFKGESEWYPNGTQYVNDAQYGTTTLIRYNTYNVRLFADEIKYYLYVNDELKVKRYDVPNVLIPETPQIVSIPGSGAMYFGVSNITIISSNITVAPTASPTAAPTPQPTPFPSNYPTGPTTPPTTVIPTLAPTFSPTNLTLSPTTYSPTLSPNTYSPTSPTSNPSRFPTYFPLESDTILPGPFNTSTPTLFGAIPIIGQSLNISLDVTVINTVPSVWTEIFSIIDPVNGDDAIWVKLFARNDVGFLFEYKAYKTQSEWYPLGIQYEGRYFVGDYTLRQDASEAEEYCQSFGSNLASIHSESDMYASQIYCTETASQVCWIGLLLNKGFHRWVWTDGTATDFGFIDSNGVTPDDSGNQGWRAGRPNGDLKLDICGYITIVNGGGWENGCSSTKYPICNGNNVQWSSTTPLLGNTYNIRLIADNVKYELYINGELEIRRDDVPTIPIPETPQMVTIKGSSGSYFEISNIRITSSNITMDPTPSPSQHPTEITSLPTILPSNAPNIAQAPTELFICSDEVMDNLDGWYDGTSVSFINNTWLDKSGNEKHATISGSDYAIVTELGNLVLIGTESTRIEWSHSLNPEHTVFILSRYRGIGDYRGMILSALYPSSFWGHIEFRSGMAKEGPNSMGGGWLTDSCCDRFGAKWVLSSAQQDLYRGNGVNLTTQHTGKIASVFSGLGIQHYDWSDSKYLKYQTSSWSVAEIMFIQIELNDDDIECVEQHFVNKYGLKLQPNITSFGITTGNESWAKSTDVYTLTMHQNGVWLYCFVTPSNKNTEYFCDANNWQIYPGGCMNYPSKALSIMISNDGTDSAEIVSVWYLEANVDRFERIQFCAPDTFAFGPEWAVYADVSFVCYGKGNPYSKFSVDNDEWGITKIVVEIAESDLDVTSLKDATSTTCFTTGSPTLHTSGPSNAPTTPSDPPTTEPTDPPTKYPKITSFGFGVGNELWAKSQDAHTVTLYNNGLFHYCLITSLSNNTEYYCNDNEWTIYKECSNYPGNNGTSIMISNHNNDGAEIISVFYVESNGNRVELDKFCAPNDMQKGMEWATYSDPSIFCGDGYSGYNPISIGNNSWMNTDLLFEFNAFVSNVSYLTYIKDATATICTDYELASIRAHCDNHSNIYISTDGGNRYTLEASSTNYKQPLYVDHVIEDQAIFRITCDNGGGSGGFIATASYNGQTFNTVEGGRFKVVSSVKGGYDSYPLSDDLLQFTPKTAAPWNITSNSDEPAITAGIDDNAMWIWNGQKNETLVFELMLLTLNPTQTPTSTPSGSPTLPTMKPTDVLLEFIHVENNSNYNANLTVLELHNFDPSRMDKIDLVNFNNKTNDDGFQGTVLFEPCSPFQTYTNSNIIFNELSMGLTANYLFDDSNPLHGETLNCKDDVLCFIRCTNERFSCFRSTFIISNISENTLIECRSPSSCESNMINISSIPQNGRVAMKCTEGLSCKDARVSVKETADFLLECLESTSCQRLVIDIISTMNAEIKCYGVDSCQYIEIYSDKNDIKLSIFNYNQNIKVQIPSDETASSLDCNPNNGYLMLQVNGLEFSSIKETAENMFGGKMPCYGLMYSFWNTSGAACEIIYEFEEYVQEMMYFKDFMSCYHPDLPIYVDDVSRYECVGTLDPTVDPTKDPTKDPTIDPTIYPTTDPTKDPTVDPTLDPTIDPTIDPTSDPTIDPTVDPTADPSRDPTIDPTQKPTRSPTVSKAYDSHFYITYLIDNLQKEEVYFMVENNVIVINDITEIIETAYVDATGLRFQFFWLVISRINNVDVGAIDYNQAPQFLASKELPLDSEIKCDEAACEMLLNDADKEQFTSNAQIKLREYFDISFSVDASAISSDVGNSSSITFTILSDVSTIEITELYPVIEEIPWYLDPMIIFLFTMMFICTNISFCALLHNKQKFPKFPGFRVVDDALWLCLIIYSLQIFDFISDVNLAIEIISSSKFKTNVIITICGILSAIFTIVPYMTNLFIASKIKQRIQDNENAKSWFQHYSNIFVLLVCLCGGCHPGLQVVSSAIFGLNILNTGLTKYELKQFNKIKIFASIVLENVPQLIVQIVYSIALESVSRITLLAFIASSISVISVVLTYFIDRQGDALVVKYILYINYNPWNAKVNAANAANDANDNDDDDDTDDFKFIKATTTAGQEEFVTQATQRIGLTNDLKQHFVNNQGRTEALTEGVCAMFDIPQKAIEFSKRSKLSSYGIQTFVIHHVEKQETIQNIGQANIYVSSLYQKKRNNINAFFRKHFLFSVNDKDFNVEFHLLESKENASISFIHPQTTSMEMQALVQGWMKENKQYKFKPIVIFGDEEEKKEEHEGNASFEITESQTGGKNQQHRGVELEIADVPLHQNYDSSDSINSQ